MGKGTWISLFCGFFGAMLFHFAQKFSDSKVQAAPEKIINTSRINLVDGTGHVRAQIGLSDGDSPGIWLMDGAGVARVSLGVYGDGAGYIGLQDRQGQMIELMRSFGVQEAPLLIFKNKGQDMMITGLDPKSTVPFLMKYEKDRTRTLQFGSYDGP